MAYNQAKSTANGIEPAVIAAVLTRSQGVCEQCYRNQWLQISHRTAKGMGGAHGDAVAIVQSAANLDHLCEVCHAMLMHYSVVRRYVGFEEHSCRTCWLKNECLDLARSRGYIDHTWSGPHPTLEETSMNRTIAALFALVGAALTVLFVRSRTSRIRYLAMEAVAALDEFDKQQEALAALAGDTSEDGAPARFRAIRYPRDGETVGPFCCRCGEDFPEPDDTARASWAMVSFADNRRSLLACSQRCFEEYVLYGPAEDFEGDAA